MLKKKKKEKKKGLGFLSDGFVFRPQLVACSRHIAPSFTSQ